MGPTCFIIFFPPTVRPFGIGMWDILIIPLAISISGVTLSVHWYACGRSSPSSPASACADMFVLVVLDVAGVAIDGCAAGAADADPDADDVVAEVVLVAVPVVFSLLPGFPGE